MSKKNFLYTFVIITNAVVLITLGINFIAIKNLDMISTNYFNFAKNIIKSNLDNGSFEFESNTSLVVAIFYCLSLVFSLSSIINVINSIYKNTPIYKSKTHFGLSLSVNLVVFFVSICSQIKLVSDNKLIEFKAGFFIYLIFGILSFSVFLLDSILKTNKETQSNTKESKEISEK